MKRDPGYPVAARKQASTQNGEIVDYLECAMVKRDACVSEFELKEKVRVERTRHAIKIK